LKLFENKCKTGKYVKQMMNVVKRYRMNDSPDSGHVTWTTTTTTVNKEHANCPKVLVNLCVRVFQQEQQIPIYSFGNIGIW